MNRMDYGSTGVNIWDVMKDIFSRLWEKDVNLEFMLRKTVHKEYVSKYELTKKAQGDK